jgi:hypothetical protein
MGVVQILSVWFFGTTALTIVEAPMKWKIVLAFACPVFLTAATIYVLYLLRPERFFEA